MLGGILPDKLQRFIKLCRFLAFLRLVVFWVIFVELVVYAFKARGLFDLLETALFRYLPILHQINVIDMLAII